MSTWADEIKSDPNWDHAGEWHWCTIPDNEYYEKGKHKGLAVEKVLEFTETLKKKTASLREKQIALKFLINLSSLNDFLPMLTPIFPSLSFLISAWPDFASETALFKFSVTEPSFGFGIRPLGPKTFPSLDNFIIIEGVQTSLSKLASDISMAMV